MKKKPYSGFGTLSFPDGSLYEGQLKKGVPHGHGYKKWGENEHKKHQYVQYTGMWVDGKMEGQGELQLAQGELYIGTFVNGFPCGFGTRKWVNGDVYKGNFVNGFQ